MLLVARGFIVCCWHLAEVSCIRVIRPQSVKESDLSERRCCLNDQPESETLCVLFDSHPQFGDAMGYR